ncbi:MAG: FixH family protein [Pseudomonadota bacterium]
MTELTNNMPTNSGDGPFKGRHFLYWIGSFFGVMFIVNGIFLYHAITSFPGEDIEKSYLQGLAYNATLATRSAQYELGWTAEAGIRDDEIVFRLFDDRGDPISARPITAQLRHRSDRNLDQPLDLKPRASGEYAAQAAGIGQGAWDMRVQVFDITGETLEFQAEKTLILE